MIGPCRRVEFLPVALAVLSGALWAQRGMFPPGYTPVDPARTKHSSAQMTVSAPEAARTVAGACSGMSLGNGASLNGFVPFPSTNAWNINIASANVDPNSAVIVAAAGFAGNHLHPDFGAESYYGIPYVVVDSTITPSVPINVLDYADESDVVVAPYPISAPIEGAPADCRDGRILIRAMLTWSCWTAQNANLLRRSIRIAATVCGTLRARPFGT